MAGRKPKYDKAMTGAEKAREYRARKKEKEEQLIYFAMNNQAVKAIDDVVEFFEFDGRAEVVWGLLQQPLKRALQVISENEKTLNDMDIQSEDDEEAIRLVKKILWDTITD